MNKNCGIYKITSPTGRVYIGQSNNIKNRWKSYKKYRNSKNPQPRLFKSFAKYGVENHQFDIIEYCSEEELNCSERFWQDEFDVLNMGLNCVLEECNSLSKKLSQKTKDKIARANKGKVFSEEHKRNLSNSSKGRVCPKELNNFYGKKHSEESKQKISISRKGKRTGEENPNSNIILDTETGVYYFGLREASEYCRYSYGYLESMLSTKNNIKNKTNLKIV